MLHAAFRETSKHDVSLFLSLFQPLFRWNKSSISIYVRDKNWIRAPILKAAFRTKFRRERLVWWSIDGENDFIDYRVWFDQLTIWQRAARKGERKDIEPTIAFPSSHK